MKRFFIIIIWIFVALPILNCCGLSSCYAQQMAAESIWHRADETGYYSMERCPYCNLFIDGKSPEEKRKKMENHIWVQHFNETDDNTGSNDGNNGDDGDYSDPYNNSNHNYNDNSNENNNGNNSSYNYKSVINIYDAARLAEQIGIDDKNHFLDRYYCYGYGYINPNTVSLRNLIDFIQRIYRARIGSYDEIEYSLTEYFAFAKSYVVGSLYYYSIHTRYNPKRDYDDYEYIYVFQ